mgnify:CR=1 FL=1
MRKVDTTRFGEIMVSLQELLTLPFGLIGFPDYKEFVLLDHEDESPFRWLQSLDDPAIAFVVMDPYVFKPDYDIDLSAQEKQSLELTKVEDALALVILTLPEDWRETTANIKAPLIFNRRTRKGRQIILNDPLLTTRFPIAAAFQRLSILIRILRPHYNT